MKTNEARFSLLGNGAFGKCDAQAIVAVEGAKLTAIAEASEEGAAQAKAHHPCANGAKSISQV